MKYRKLRIAFSVACGIASVLLVVVWVRSCSRMDTMPLWSHGDVYSIGGRFIAILANREVVFRSAELDALVTFNDMWFDYMRGPGFRGIVIPHWFPMLLVAVPGLIAAYPSLRQLNWQYSLRALLIATTLVAVVLGLIIYTSK